jgi:hypothetical protein
VTTTATTTAGAKMNPDQFPDPELCLHQMEQENKALRQQLKDTEAQRNALAAMLVEQVGEDGLKACLTKAGF